MSGFRCLALETGVATPSVAACNADRYFETRLTSGTKVAAALFEAIDEVLDQVALSLEDLDCIAFGRGPGAFTGLRVAAAAAQGLAVGLGIGLCAVSSLAALAQDAYERALVQRQARKRGRPAQERARMARERGRPALDETRGGLAPIDGVTTARAWVAPSLQAGREQVYMGWYRVGESGLVSAEADDWLSPAADCRVPGAHPFIAAGKPWVEHATMRAHHRSRIVRCEERAVPRAGAVLRLAYGEYAQNRLLEPQDAQPVYLRSAV